MLFSKCVLSREESSKQADIRGFLKDGSIWVYIGEREVMFPTRVYLVLVGNMTTCGSVSDSHCHLFRYFIQPYGADTV